MASPGPTVHIFPGELYELHYNQNSMDFWEFNERCPSSFAASEGTLNPCAALSAFLPLSNPTAASSMGTHRTWLPSAPPASQQPAEGSLEQPWKPRRGHMVWEVTASTKSQQHPAASPSSPRPGGGGQEQGQGTHIPMAQGEQHPLA